MSQNTFFNQPYSDRQLILFIDDIAIAASQKVTRAKTPYRDFTKFAKEVGKAMTIAVPGGSFVELAVETLFSYWEAQKEGVENFKLVEKSKINLFQLPPGHPRDRMVYAGHPGLPTVYVPLADFHRLTFEHKFAEVISLLMHLGAKTFKVEHVTGWGAEFSSHLAIGLPTTFAEIDIGTEAGSTQHTKQTILFHTELDNKQAPSLPANLVWYPYEATWQQIAEGRLQFGLKNFSLYLNYNDDFGINAGLKLKIEKAGLDLGGTFERLVATTWRISGDFAAKSSEEKSR